MEDIFGSLKNIIKSPFNQQVKGKIIYIIIINIILKFPMLFLDVVPSDIYFYWSTGQVLLRGFVPYLDFERYIMYEGFLYENIIHPNGPLNYLLYSLFELILGGSVFAIKLPMLIAEVMSSVMIFKVACLFMSEKKSFFLTLIYTTCPISFYPMILIGCDEIITAMFAISSVYYFFKSKPLLSSTLLALGTWYKFYCVFFLIPFAVYYLGQIIVHSNYKIWLRVREPLFFMIGFLLTSLIICFPYLVMCPTEFIKWTFLQANRLTTISFGVLFEDSILYSPIFNLDLIHISLLNIIQIGVVGIFSIMLVKWMVAAIRNLRDNKDTTVLEKKMGLLVIKGCAFFTLILPLLSLSSNYRYFFWMFPFLLIAIFSRVVVDEEKITQNLIKIINNFIIGNSVIIGGGIIFSLVDFEYYFPLNITHYFNAYISLFFAIFLIWGFYLYYSFRSSPASILLIMGSVFSGLANLFAYIGIIAEGTGLFGDIGDVIFYAVAGILVLISTIIFIYIIFIIEPRLYGILLDLRTATKNE